MPPAARTPRAYHHGDLPAALRAAVIELVTERGPHGFSLVEAARRAGVTAAAPYRHFPDRESLLAAVAVEAFESLRADLVAADTADGGAPDSRLAAMAAAYVLFARQSRAQFLVLFSAGIDKDRHPEVRSAGERALSVVTAVVAELDFPAPTLALDLWALAHGYASLLADGSLETHDVDVGQAARLARQGAIRLIDRRGTLHGGQLAAD